MIDGRPASASTIAGIHPDGGGVAMTDPDETAAGGSDYGYDLAHDVPRGARGAARAAEPAQSPRRRADPFPLTGGDYGYDEAHGGH
jgi:hypothetical protein